ncbi:MAG TPA: PLP-dependent aminotransferase family protein [Thermoanaerobaculia bacterium]|nr:PLP-dependent aminotransferase family protein [Thermoanaerobaculia bacterium]
MPRWEFPIALDRTKELPLFLQVARSISEDIRRGRLKPGDRLPGSRLLARELGVNRNTIVAGYRELEAEGWVTGAEASGTFVSATLPCACPRAFGVLRSAVPRRAGFDFGPPPGLAFDAIRPRGTLGFGTGTPDLRLVPVGPLARAYRRALDSRGREVLDYQTCGRSATALEDGAYGSRTLRGALARMLASTRGLAAAWENLIVTRGSQMGLLLVARALLAPGDVVAMEELGSKAVREAFRQSGAKLDVLPVDDEGVRVDALRALAEREPRLRAVYVTPHHQHPTTVTLSPGRRLELLELARQRRIAIVEDDYDHEFHYEARPILPMASVDTAGVVIYVGSLSKVLAPGLRIGYVVAPQPLVDRLALLRLAVDVQGDLAVESAVAELIEDGELARHVRRVRRLYRERRDLLASALEAEFGSEVSFRVPTGGMALWVRAAEGLDVDRWASLAVEERVSFLPGRFFAFDDKPLPFFRLGFTGLAEAELLEAVKRLARARRRLGSAREREARAPRGLATTAL